jgi:6-pyruvoyltetrahydropterin/6-carboxytetrahydropterin synthase
MSRWVVHARAGFRARHGLTAYRGQPEASHEHQWTVAIRVGTEDLDEDGLALDFHAVRGLLDRVIAPLEDTDLNAHPEIGRPTPSAERLAEVVAGWLEPELERLGGTLLRVSVWEGPDNRVDLNLR